MIILEILFVLFLSTVWLLSCWFSAGIIDATRILNSVDGLTHDTKWAKIGWYTLAGLIALFGTFSLLTVFLFIDSGGF